MPRQLTLWRWFELAAVAVPASIVVPASAIALLAALVGGAELLAPSAIADLGWGPAMAGAVLLWLPLVGVTAYPVLLVVIALGPRQVCLRPPLKWVALACGFAGAATCVFLLSQGLGGDLVATGFSLGVFGVPSAIGLRYMWALLTTRVSPEDRQAVRDARAVHRAPRAPRPMGPILKSALVFAAAVLLVAGGIGAWLSRPKPDGVHQSYYLWAGEEFFWGRKERLKAEVPYLDGKRHGVARTYQRNGGALWQELSYADGELHGLSTTYRFNSRAVLEETMYERGVRLWKKTYASAGYLSREVEYEDGEDRGRFVEYDRFGRVIKEGIRRGAWTLESVSTTYAPDGSVLKRTRYRHGEGHSEIAVPSDEPGGGS